MVGGRSYHFRFRPIFMGLLPCIRVLTPIITAPLYFQFHFVRVFSGANACKCLNTRKALPSESVSSPSTNEWCLYMSSVQYLGSLQYIGVYTTELYGDYTTELVTLGIYRG